MARRLGGLTVAVTALPLMISGCGAGGSGDSGGGGNDGNVPTSVKLGVIQPMTGAFAVLGTVVKNSMQVQVDKINAAGGVNGAKLELVVRDMQLDPAKAVQFSNELARDPQVKLVVGPSISAFYEAAKKTFEDTEMINCQPAVASQDWSALKVGFQAQDEAETVVVRLLEFLQSKGVTKVGMVENNDDGGRTYHGLFEKLAPDYGVALVGWEQSRSDDQSHLAYVQKLMGKGAEAIWMSNVASGALTAAAAGKAGFQGLLITGNGLSSLPNIEATGDMLGKTAFTAGGFYYAAEDKSSWPAGYKEWAEALDKQFGKDAGPKTGVSILRGAPQAADCVAAFSAAAEKAQSFDRKKLAEAMETISIPGSESPSGCDIHPGDDHSLYEASCGRVYIWKQGTGGWVTEDVTPEK